METAQVEKRAQALFKGGLHCAEAVLLAVGEALNLSAQACPRAATAFGGGVGRGEQELCGALAGGLIAIGLAEGRAAPGGGWDTAARLGAELRAGFVARHGCTRCAELLERQGGLPAGADCATLTSGTAGEVLRLLAAG